MSSCPKCGETLAGSVPGEMVAFRHFRGAWSTWEQLFRQAAEFAGRIGRQRLISISHSADHSDGVVTVWYWTGGQPQHPPST